MADWIRNTSLVHMFRRRFGVEMTSGASDQALRKYIILNILQTSPLCWQTKYSLTSKINSHQVKPAILTKPSPHHLTIPFWTHVKSPDKQAVLLRKADPEKMHYNKEGEGAKLRNDRALFLKLSLSKQLRTVTFIFLHNWSTLKNPNKSACKSEKQLFKDLFFFLKFFLMFVLPQAMALNGPALCIKFFTQDFMV